MYVKFILVTWGNGLSFCTGQVQRKACMLVLFNIVSPASSHLPVHHLLSPSATPPLSSPAFPLPNRALATPKER